MDRSERFYKIDALLHALRVVPIDRMLQELEVSRAIIQSGQHPAEDVEKHCRLLTTGQQAVQARH